MALCILAAGCASPRRSLTLRVAVAPDANDRTPIPVDVVFAWDKAVAAKIGALTAADWFAAKPQFRQDDPRQRTLTICEWEWVPGQAVPEINLAVPVAARRWIQAVYVFANYRTPGSHRARLTLGSVAALDLQRQNSAVRSLGRSTSPTFTWVDDACPAAVPAPADQARSVS